MNVSYGHYDTYLIVERLAHERVLLQTHARAPVGRHPGVFLEVVAQDNGIGSGVEVGQRVACQHHNICSGLF